ncbi:hypothetical protein yc1106_01658 [Curvularia clavata]|uniref:C2H2-type domain-containing protein n=1 Tax=Curvularia clavata TaxID=95742 RepID=A0A9Q8Z1U1_CURCL|nr:hypothetical protein yc1106_01658 [Curvularia clavata]
MSANAYNQYNQPYQQSSAQQYASYQTASASDNGAQSSRQYQLPPTQSHDYRSYTSQSYTHRGNGYTTSQDTTWNQGSYGGARETTNQAAKVLHDMSNPSYTTSIAATPAFTSHSATSSHPSRYATASPLAGNSRPVHEQSQAQNANIDRAKLEIHALPSPTAVPDNLSHATKPMYNQQPQRVASPAQPQYNTTTVSNAHGATSITENQYGRHSSQQLTSAETSRPSTTPSSTYNYGTELMRPAAVAPPVTDDTYYTQTTTTVDPMAVYDPWPEYQRKQAAQKAAEDAAHAERERIGAEERKAEEQKKAGERKRQEEMDRLRQSQSSSTLETGQVEQRPSGTGAASALSVSDGGSGDALEVEIRAMMAKMRELNNKDPALLARIWEEERKAKAPRPSIQTKPPPQAAIARPTQPAHASRPPPAISRESTTPREVTNAHVSKPATPATAHAVPVRQAQIPANRPPGTTIWPQQKRAELAKAAAQYLNSQECLHKVTPGRILSLLNENPSYIQLCEQLEQMNLKLDRAAFAKSLLTAVPDVNSRSNQSPPLTAPAPVQRPPIPPAVMKKEVSNSVAPTPQYTPAAGPPTSRVSYSPYPENASPAGPPAPAPVAEMMPIKPELRRPANKEEAARKRNLSELVDLTQLSDEDAGPPFKKLDTGFKNKLGPPPLDSQGAMDGNEQLSTPNFPVANGPMQPPQSLAMRPPVPSELRNTTYVHPIERNKALRRNNYNPATIARDVLLACGRHPSQRSLNAHLDALRTTLSQITFDSDLSTIRWDLIDPGNPPPDYFKDKVEDLAQDADDEDDSDDEERPHPRSPSNVIGGQGAAQAKVQALPEAVNPFVKQKRRGRPPRNSLSNNVERPKSPAPMSSSAKPSPGAAGVGYSAFRSATQYAPDGSPIPKKRGRPVGWRKATHGSAATQAPRNLSKATETTKMDQPPQPSSLSNAHTGDSVIRIDSRSPSVANRVFPSYKCRWLNCKADLHNLDTLKKHVFKVHRKEARGNMLDCLWGDCGKESQPPSFDLESDWRRHIHQTHFDPLSWELGDGPASGLSVDPERVRALSTRPPDIISRGRGRPPKRTLEQDARDAHDRLMSLKSRIGGPGMDRGGATLVSDKRRRGLIDEIEEEIVNMED